METGQDLGNNLITFLSAGIIKFTQNRYLCAKTNKPFCCDFVEALKLCHLTGGMYKRQLKNFLMLVKRGQFMKGAAWQWIDEMKGYTGNLVIDNLLKLALIYRKDKNLPGMESIALRILEYDGLKEEATWLNICCHRKINNAHQARFYFNSFRSRYLKSMAEDYPMNFEEFINQCKGLLQDSIQFKKHINEK